MSQTLGQISEKDLIKWANEKSGNPDLHIKKFKDKKLKDSQFLFALLRAVEPRSLNEELILPGKDDDEREQNAKYVCSVARKLGCVIFLVWEDITEVKDKMILTLVAQIKYVAENGPQEEMIDVRGKMH